MRSLWSLATILSLAVWVGFVGVQAKKHGGPAKPPAISSPGEDLNISERDEWFSFTSKGKKVGFAHLKLEEASDGYTLSESFLLRLRLLDEPQEIRSQGFFSLKKDFSLSSFFMDFVARGVSFLIRGKVRDDTLIVSVDFPGSEQEKRIPLERPIYIAAGLKPFLAAANLEPGDTLSVEVFDPVAMKVFSIPVTAEAYDNLTVKGRTVKALRVVTDYQGATFKTWLGPSGETVKEQGLLGITMIAATEKEATRGIGEVADIYRESSVIVEGRLRDPAGLRGLKLEVAGADLSGFDVNAARQNYDGKILKVVKEDVPPDAGYLLPHPGGELDRYLKPSFLIQSDNKEIIAAAREALGAEKDPVEAVGRILSYVNKRLRKKPTVALPDAASTLKRGFGDCNEYTAVFCALARAAGLPARPIAGLVFSRGRFYYHAWAEVYLGRWVSVDPLMGQFPADVSHLRLVAGGLDRQVKLAGLMGKLRFRVEDSW